MPILVHIADEKNSARIKRSGIALGKRKRVVYFMPVLHELFIERKIDASEITRIRHLLQKTGWRYMPHAHGRQPCGCPACVRGTYGARALRDKYDPMPARTPYAAVKQVLLESTDEDALIGALWALRDKRRIADPAFLERLLEIDNAELHEALAFTLGYFKHDNALRLLQSLQEHAVPEVRDAALAVIHRLQGQ